MAYNTGNPIGSFDPRDAADNKENFDRFALSAERTYTDRLGVERKTVTGTLQDYAAYNSRGVWTTATAYNVNDIWRDGPTGAFYLVLADYTSGASAAADIAGGNVVVHQPKDWVVSVATIADLRALEPAFDGQQVELLGHTVAGFGGGVFYADYGSTAADDNGVVVVTTGGARWKRKIENNTISFEMFGARGDGVTVDTAAMQSAIDNCPAGGTVEAFSCTYLGYLFIWRSNITLQSRAIGRTQIKLPNNTAYVTVPLEGGSTVSVLPNVIEVGECGLGNDANEYTGVNVIGFNLDGNYANNIEPTNDLSGHGIIVTKTSNCNFDVSASDCYLTGADIVINSNNNHGQFRVSNCGQAALNYPNFDINSSKFLSLDVISTGGKYGGRMLDNCWGNNITITCNAPSITGFVYNNQVVNESFGNNITVSVIGGCAGGQAMSIGDNCHSSNITLNAKGVGGPAMYVWETSSASASRGNTVTVNSYSASTHALRAAGSNNTYNVNSHKDCVGGSPGDSYAIESYGTNNTFNVNIDGGSYARALAFRSGSTGNKIASYVATGVVSGILDQDTTGSNVYQPDSWIDATLESGWSNTFGSPYPAAGYIKNELGEVRMRGTITGGAGTAIILPAGFRPSSKLRFATDSEGAVAIVEIDTAGNITVSSGSVSSVELSPIIFLNY